MPRRPDNLETVRLAFELLRRIPRQRKVSSADLHAQLSAAGIDRDLRTIQRQLESLSEHFDIERDDRTKPYGYRWKEQAKGITLPGMTEKEALLLALAEQHLRKLLPAKVLRTLEDFFTQARRNLAHGRGASLERQWLDKVRIVSTSQPLLPPPIRDGVLEEVSNALFGNHWLEVDYRNASGRRAKVEVMPLGMAQQGPSLYLVCRYRGFANERHQALHRMLAARALNEGFERPKDFDLERYDGEGRFGLGDGERINLSFEIERGAGLHLLETRLSTDQTVVDRGKKLWITATVMESEWLWRWVRGFGSAITGVKVDGRARRASL